MLALIVAAIPATAQDDANRFAAQLAAKNGIAVKGLKPWHLKLSYLAPDPVAGGDTAGSLEEWWDAPDHWRQEWTSDGATATVVRTPGGLSQPADFVPRSVPVQLLVEQILAPIDLEDLRATTPEMRELPNNQVKLRCVMLTQPIKDVKEVPLGLFPTYCADGDALRFARVGVTLSVTPTKMGTFQGQFVPIQTHVWDGRKLLLEGTVEQLSTYTPEPDPASTSSTTADSKEQKAVRVAGGVLAGHKISGPPPVYPLSARQARLRGTVVMQAKIGVDGRVHTVQVMSSPGPDLSLASITAVQQWIYRPYLLNGSPTDVLTTITMNFDIN